MDSNSEFNAWLEERFNNNKKIAEEGDVEAQYNVGIAYLRGNEVSNNPQEAEKWLLKAAEHGHIKAIEELANCYYFMSNIYHFKKDAKKAYSFYKYLADQGDGGAMCMIANLFKKNVLPDLVENETESNKLAFDWYKKSADTGHGVGMLQCAEYYKNGEVVPQDFDLAFQFYSLAAQSHEKVIAYLPLADCYIKGIGTERNYSQALYCLNCLLNETPVDDDKASALYRIGLLYENGWGVPFNYSTAVEYYQKAAVLGNNDATEALKSFSKGLFGWKRI